jgi:hypothetical protein
MTFFANRAVNRIYLHYGIQALARGAGGVFFLVFLLRSGFSVPATLTAMAAILAARFCLRPALVPLAVRFGLKRVLIAGTIAMGLQYPLLAAVHGPGWALAGLIVASALGEVLYFPSFNAYFATLGDTQHRGHQVGAAEAMAAVAGIVAPLMGAASLVTLGPGPTFAAVGVVQAASALPLLGAPDAPVRAKAPGAWSAARDVTLFYLTDGWADACWGYVWQMALFLSLGHSIAAYGGAMALAGLTGAVCGIVIGPRIDAGRWRMALSVAFGLAAVIVIARAASLAEPWLAVGANALGSVLIPILSPTIGGATYNLAEASPCPLRYQVAGEAGWDLGCAAACLTAAALLSLGAPIGYAILLGLPGLAVGAAQLSRMYRQLA